MSDKNRITCPDCNGVGRILSRIPGVPPEVCVKNAPCDRCWPRDEDGERLMSNDGTAGTIPADSAPEQPISDAGGDR